MVLAAAVWFARPARHNCSSLPERAAWNYNERAMRIVARCLLLGAGTVVLTQSSGDLHNRYGEPGLERFAVRPGISLTVQYGSDHLVCQALIEPPKSLIHPDEQTSLMSSEGVSEVLEEVAPVAVRGEQISDGSFQSGCNVGRFTEYENVWIMRATHECDPSSEDRDVSTSINFKRDICPKPKAPVTVTRP